ncbi:MAG TPA: hypothetical protein GX501_05135 [Clostridiaceae bacterium]|nr:hypothetical protein [Clostridiaceae bacterium]
MKLLFAIVSDEDSSILADNLSRDGFSTTKLCSSGGFLKSGNTTFLVATDDDRVERAIEIIRDTCKSRRRMIAPEKLPGSFGSFNMAMPVEVTVGGATVFILNIEQFLKL